jgi:hypothetical protein
MKAGTNPFAEKPHTRVGWLAVWLGVIFVVMFLLNSFVLMPTASDTPWRHIILPFYAIAMLLCGLTSGMLGFFAVVRQHERSWMVLLTLLPGLWVLFMLVGEFLFPH